MVISQWVGFEKTDESHYIDGSNSWMAPVVFQTVASSLLQYTPGTSFTVENAYALNGLDTTNPTTPQVSTSQIEDQVNYWTERAQELLDQTQQNITDADLPSKAKSLWDSFMGLFQ